MDTQERTQEALSKTIALASLIICDKQ